jgi:hypothetical protein
MALLQRHPAPSQINTQELRPALGAVEAPGRSRWLWLVPPLAGLLMVVGRVIASDPGQGLDLSPRGRLTLALAGLVALLLAFLRWPWGRHPALVIAGYALVALLAAQLAAPPANAAPPATPRREAPRTTRALDRAAECPPIGEQPIAWAKCTWKAAGAKAAHSPTTTTGRSR